MLTEMKIKTMIKELEKNNKEISKIRESINDFIENKNRLIERLEKENEKLWMQSEKRGNPHLIKLIFRNLVLLNKWILLK